jgi:hypothetical protein
MIKNIELENKTVLGLDSGLDSRGFAQAKLARFIVEPGFIVRGNNVELWKVSGVAEISGDQKKSTMVVWGPSFEGERLDLLLGKSGQQDKALAAIARWIQAFLVLKEKDSGCSPPLWPCAAIIGETEVFFAPSNLAWSCMTAFERIAQLSGRYVHPGFHDMDAAAFTAAAMLYHTLSGMPPFIASDDTILHEDMREGNFLPVRFAVPGLDLRLCALIQNALNPVEKRTGGVSGNARGITLLNSIFAIVQSGGQTVSTASLVKPLSQDERSLLEKEKKRFVKRKAAAQKVKHFVTRNKAALIVSFAALVIAVIIGINVRGSRSSLPSTAGLDPLQVIGRYYNAIGEMDHQMMEACVLRNAGKSDINMVINFFVVSKMREFYEASNAPVIISASVWQQGGRAAFDSRAFQVFGVTDLIIKKTAESGTDTATYQASYTLWVPVAVAAEVSSGTGAPEEALSNTDMPYPYHRSDLVTLVKQKEGWRIAEIQRKEE